MALGQRSTLAYIRVSSNEGNRRAGNTDDVQRRIERIDTAHHQTHSPRVKVEDLGGETTAQPRHRTRLTLRGDGRCSDRDRTAVAVGHEVHRHATRV